MFHHITRCFKNSFTQSRRLVSLTVVKCTMCYFKEVIQACPYALINVRPHYHIHELKVGDSRDRPLGSGDLSLYILQFAKVLSFVFNKSRRFIVRPADGDLSANLHLPHTRGGTPLRSCDRGQSKST